MNPIQINILAVCMFPKTRAAVCQIFVNFSAQKSFPLAIILIVPAGEGSARSESCEFETRRFQIIHPDT